MRFRSVFAIVLMMLSCASPVGAQETSPPASTDGVSPVARVNKERLYTRETEVESIRAQRDKYEYYRIQRRQKEEQCRQDPTSPVCKELETCVGPGCGIAGR